MPPLGLPEQHGQGWTAASVSGPPRLTPPPQETSHACEPTLAACLSASRELHAAGWNLRQTSERSELSARALYLPAAIASLQPPKAAVAFAGSPRVQLLSATVVGPSFAGCMPSARPIFLRRRFPATAQPYLSAPPYGALRATLKAGAIGACGACRIRALATLRVAKASRRYWRLRESCYPVQRTPRAGPVLAPSTPYRSSWTPQAAAARPS